MLITIEIENREDYPENYIRHILSWDPSARGAIVYLHLSCGHKIPHAASPMIKSCKTAYCHVCYKENPANSGKNSESGE
jgi:hypothetical protein